MIYGELPTKPVVYAACDTKYFVEHAPSLIYSINDIGKDIHIHICEVYIRDLFRVFTIYTHVNIVYKPIDEYLYIYIYVFIGHL